MPPLLPAVVPETQKKSSTRPKKDKCYDNWGKYSGKCTIFDPVFERSGCCAASGATLQ